MLRVLCACTAVAFGAAHAAVTSGSDSQPVRLGTIVGTEVEGFGLPHDARITDARLAPDGKQLRAFVVTAGGKTVDCAFVPIASAADIVRLASPQGATCSAATPEAGSFTYTDAVKAHVRDRQHEVVGQVKDFYIDARTGAVTHTITEFDPAWYTSKGWVALPSSSLALDNGDFVARFRKDDMRAANGKVQAAAATSEAPPQPPPGFRRVDVRASTWLGRLVRDGEGKTIGRIADLWLDVSRKDAAIASVMPAAGGEPIACRIGAHGLAAEPDAFIDRTEPPARGAPCAASPQLLEPSANFESANAMLGSHIKSTEGDDVGTLRDVVLEADGGRVHYLLADFASQWVQDGKLTILPARPLHHDAGGNWMQASLAELQRFPMVAEARVDDVSAASFAKAVDGYLAQGR